MPHNVSCLQQPRIRVFNEPTLGLEIMYYAKTRRHELVCLCKISGCFGGRSRAAVLSAVGRAPNNVKVVLRVHRIIPGRNVNDVRGAITIIPIHLDDLPAICPERFTNAARATAQVQQSRLKSVTGIDFAALTAQTRACC